jgi:hypothetical protein
MRTYTRWGSWGSWGSWGAGRQCQRQSVAQPASACPLDTQPCASGEERTGVAGLFNPALNFLRGTADSTAATAEPGTAPGMHGVPGVSPPPTAASVDGVAQGSVPIDAVAPLPVLVWQDGRVLGAAPPSSD